MLTALKRAPPTYVAPGREKLGGELLDKYYDSMRKKVEERDKMGQLSSKFASTYVSDGWDSRM